mgnify:FL=1
MAKPDWGELQQRFLSEHAATGVSPKEWCEAQGLNYATARRYIKKTSAQKPAQKKMRTAQKDKSANELVDDDGLTAQQCLFVAEYLKDNNATAAAARAGYSDPNYGRQLITNPNVAQAIAHQQKASIARTLGGADEVLAQIWQLATFDANQLSQYRRGACRYCWGFGHQYQWRDMVEFEEKRLEALERKSREPVDVGGYGYDHTREANPGCPRCNGDGIGQPYFPDTRKLPATSRLAYSGVKVGLDKTVNTEGNQSISGEKNFTGPLKITAAYPQIILWATAQPNGTYGRVVTFGSEGNKTFIAARQWEGGNNTCVTYLPTFKDGYFTFWTTSNTTVTSDGTIKQASPIARIVKSQGENRRTDVENDGFTWCGFRPRVHYVDINLHWGRFVIITITGQLFAEFFHFQQPAVDFDLLETLSELAIRQAKPFHYGFEHSLTADSGYLDAVLTDVL